MKSLSSSLSAYAPLETPQTDHPPSSTADSDSFFTRSPPPAPPQLEQPPSPPAPSTAEHVDLLFQKWSLAVAHRIKSRTKPKRGRAQGNRDDPDPVLDEQAVVEVAETVFKQCQDEEYRQPEEPSGGHGRGKGKERERHPHAPPMNHERFLELVDSVRLAISQNIHPRLNPKGSSGSYFSRSPTGETLGIFKPRDEEPYGHLNPKFLKWLHRTFLRPIIPFGRACLIPGQSYLSESAASVLDRELGIDIVPRTEVVSLASEAFFYSFLDRERGGRGKDGSFQVFLKGYTDASDFLSKHPYPGRPVTPSSRTAKPTQPKSRRHRRRGCFGALLCLCGRAGAEEILDEEQAGSANRHVGNDEDGDKFEWTEEMVESFREGLECLVILDFLIRNTDRGLDNFMLKPCSSCEPPPALSAPSSASSPPPLAENKGRPHLHLAAIDNSLAFPHTHPKGWRQYPYGWLYLPLFLIGRPWSDETRQRFLPKLSDPIWWTRLKHKLRKEFEKDKGFREEMWEKQWALVKGQGWNLAESLKREDEGPVELCRRPKKLVWDDYVLAHATSLSPQPPSLRPDPAPLSFGQAAADLFSPSNSATSSRPRLQSRASEPYRPCSPPAPGPSSRAPQPSKPELKHRRSASHPHATSSYSTFNPTARARTTRPKSVAVPISPNGAQVSSPSSFSSAAALRKPLDSLSASLSRLPMQARPQEEGGEEEINEVGEGEGEEGEETGVGLMRRLDKVEEVERKRLWKAGRDRAAREALEHGYVDSEEGGEEEGPGEWLGDEARTEGGMSRSLPPSSASGFLVAGSKRRWSLVRRSVSDETTPAEGERRPLLDPTKSQRDDFPAPSSSASSSPVLGTDAKMSMSWYGGQRLHGVDEAIEEDPEDESRAEHENGGRERSRKKWVIVERLEEVKEPRRLWWPLRWRM
ncbi:hypothetical protein JCM11641_005704 [Rhodosporidiobolus odoratus]